MRFLVTTKPKHFVPPEVSLGLIDALTAWADRYTAEGKLEDIWSFVGIAGGGGILNVDSLDEVDAIMGQFPFGPFSDVAIYPLVDLDSSLQRAKETISAALAQSGS